MRAPQPGHPPGTNTRPTHYTLSQTGVSTSRHTPAGLRGAVARRASGLLFAESRLAPPHRARGPAGRTIYGDLGWHCYGAGAGVGREAGAQIAA